MNFFGRSIYAQLSLAILALFVILAATLAVTVDYSSQALREETAQQLHLELAEHLVAENPLWSQGELNQLAIKDAFHMMMILGPSIELYLLDKEGAIVAYDAPDEKIKRTAINLTPITTFIESDHPLPILGDDPRSLEREKIFSVAPIYENEVLKGYLYIIIGGEQYDSIATVLQSNYRLRIAMLGVLIVLALMLMLSLVFFYFLTKPLRLLSLAVTDFQESDFSVMPEGLESVQGGNEIVQLNNAFHNMALRIDQQLRELKDTDQLRRVLITHVSHDLRTPLTGVRGYLETSLTSNVAEDKKTECLTAAYRLCDTLEKRIDDLLELARLDSHDIPLVSEPFRMNELLADLVPQFQGLAEDKDINFSFMYDALCEYEVKADLAKIERVVCNLLENAMRYTPVSGNVTLDLMYKPESTSMLCSVINTGPSISNDDIQRIFEPYYRADNAAGVREGQGLGLAISQRLLALHEVKLLAESNDIDGTTFAFELPVMV